MTRNWISRIAVDFVATLALLWGLAGLASALTADQGAPGRQGPWPITLVPAGGLISIANPVVTEPATPVLGSACVELSTTVTGMASGHACAIGGPDNPGMTVQCITATDSIHFRFCNASLAPGLTAAGDYTAVVF